MTEAVLTCYNHPERETSLRCNRCGEPICGQCAVRTPVGYRCPTCVRGQQNLFDTASWIDYPVALVISAVGVGIAIGLLRLLWIWGFLLAPVVGGGLAEAVRWGVRRRRSRRLPLTAALGGAIGALPHLSLPLLSVILAVAGQLDGAGIMGGLIGALWPAVFAALLVGSLYYRLRGISL